MQLYILQNLLRFLFTAFVLKFPLTRNSYERFLCFPLLLNHTKFHPDAEEALLFIILDVSVSARLCFHMFDRKNYLLHIGGFVVCSM